LTIEPGDLEGGPNNSHSGDQWLYVLSGRGKAVVEGRTIDLKPGSLLVIESGEKHQVECHGKEPLETLNFFAPPQF
jgi:mannose-6-phosphate isomerase-like protein (cupin superfamily)